MEHWSLLEADFQEYYGLDLDGDLLNSKSFRWLHVRVVGLFALESRLYRVLFSPPSKGGDASCR